MAKLVINTLSIGFVYEIYTRYLLKQINKLGIKDILFCVTSDKDFSKSLKSSSVEVSFNLLTEHSATNSGASDDIYRSTVFKYYLKSLAIKYAAREFPNHPILHIDCDSIPNENFNLEFVNENNSSGIYCGEFVTCSGNYSIIKNNVGEIHLNEKILPIFQKYLNNIKKEEIYNLEFPIEGRLLFKNMSSEKIISFCDSWYEIGNYVRESGLPTYGDCFEIKAAAIINNIDIFKVSNLPFIDPHKNVFLEKLKKTNNGKLHSISDEFIEMFLENF